jgi:hypothetical protein
MIQPERLALRLEMLGIDSNTLTPTEVRLKVESRLEDYKKRTFNYVDALEIQHAEQILEDLKIYKMLQETYIWLMDALSKHLELQCAAFISQIINNNGNK